MRYKKEKIPGSKFTAYVPYGFSIDYTNASSGYDDWLDWEKEHVKSEKKEKICCNKPEIYENIISSSLKFWVCKNCKKEADRPKHSLSQEEINKLFDPN